jgi:hypothetical protein
LLFNWVYSAHFLEEMVKNYKGYKEGTNSRGLPSKNVEPPNPTNTVLTLDATFQEACEEASKKLVGVPGSHKKNRKTPKLRSQRGKAAWQVGLKLATIAPTKRQASKWKRKMGAAYQAAHDPSPVMEITELAA